MSEVLSDTGAMGHAESSKTPETDNDLVVQSPMTQSLGAVVVAAEHDFWEDGVEPDWFYFTD